MQKSETFLTASEISFYIFSWPVLCFCNLKTQKLSSLLVKITTDIVTFMIVKSTVITRVGIFRSRDGSEKFDEDCVEYVDQRSETTKFQ